jgi:hypothetical protein
MIRPRRGLCAATRARSGVVMARATVFQRAKR